MYLEFLRAPAVPSALEIQKRVGFFSCLTPPSRCASAYCQLRQSKAKMPKSCFRAFGRVAVRGHHRSIPIIMFVGVFGVCLGPVNYFMNSPVNCLGPVCLGPVCGCIWRLQLFHDMSPKMIFSQKQSFSRLQPQNPTQFPQSAQDRTLASTASRLVRAWSLVVPL